ncbi:MAG TPA: hypothetical protein VLW17_03590 [Thermoanaerobaculaceae bacterium]|nr:hypothetical protein [Thermoanaerobaculaceae bacterium]
MSRIRWTVGIAAVATLLLAMPVVAADQPVVNGGERTVDLAMLQSLNPMAQAAATAQIEPGDLINCTPLCSECLWLDTYNVNDTYDPGTGNGALVNTVTTTNVLGSGQLYMITIVGTNSFWPDNSTWWEGPCGPTGKPELGPIYPSPGNAGGTNPWVGVDWEYMFGYPSNCIGGLGDFLKDGPLFFAPDKNVSLDGGATWQHLVPYGGQAYNSTHTYSYLVVGKNLKASFRILDSGPHSDNFGRFHICIQRVTFCGSTSTS